MTCCWHPARAGFLATEATQMLLHVYLVVPSGPLSAPTDRDAVLQGTAVFMSYLPVYAGFRDTMGWGGAVMTFLWT